MPKQTFGRAAPGRTPRSTLRIITEEGNINNVPDSKVTVGIFVTVVLVVVGNLFTNDKFRPDQIVALVVLALFLLVMEEVNLQLANAFSMLVMIIAILRQGPKILKGLGVMK